MNLVSNDWQRAMTLLQKAAFDCDVRTFQLCADYGCGFQMGEFDLRPHAYVLFWRRSSEDYGNQVVSCELWKSWRKGGRVWRIAILGWRLVHKFADCQPNVLLSEICAYPDA